jgi:hypothetical protein
MLDHLHKWGDKSMKLAIYWSFCLALVMQCFEEAPDLQANSSITKVKYELTDAVRSNPPRSTLSQSRFTNNNYTSEQRCPLLPTFSVFSM